jgi:hypothetical protein
LGKLLYDTKPLVVDPKLASLIGLNESIVLQQIHYWLEINRQADKNFRDGYYWIYNSYPQWLEQFPFWSESTVKRTIKHLEKVNLLITGCFNKLSMDRTKWYRINYELLETLENQPIGQNDPTNRPKRPDHEGEVTRPIPEITTEINSEIKMDNGSIENHNRPSYTLFKKLNSKGRIDNIDEPMENVRYFFRRYKEVFKRDHPALKNEQVRQAYERFKEHDEMFSVEYGREIIDRYFETQFPTWDVDYNLMHFISGEIIDMRAFEVM